MCNQILSADYRYRKLQRLTKPAQFQLVYRSKRWGSNAHFSFNISVAKTQHTRLGVTVSKKVSKLAVKRNLIKRQTREFFRLNNKQLTAKLGHVDLVITARVSCAQLSKNERQQALHSIWQKIIRLNKEQIS